MAKEDGLYICKWTKTTDGYKLWLRSKPAISVEGAGDFHVLSEHLSEVITENGGAYHAVLEFVPAPPLNEHDLRFSKTSLVSVGGDPFSIAGVSIDLETAKFFDQYFLNSTCLECSSQTSPRNQTQLDLDYVKGDAGYVAHFHRSLPVFSECFIALLPDNEIEMLEWREVKTPKRTRKRFFELLGPVDFSPVGTNTLTPTGWECAACGSRAFGYYCPETEFKTFVPESTVLNSNRTVFVLGDGWLELCLKLELWQRLIGKPCTTGISSTPIGIVPESEIVRNPSLPLKGDLKSSRTNDLSAVRSAVLACQSSNWSDSECIASLAAAYFVAGDYKRAIKVQQKCLKLAKTSAEAQNYQILLDQYFNENDDPRSAQ